MDKVRLGRALGYGARHAAKALTQAVDAATTPSSAPVGTRPAAAARPAPSASQAVTEAGRTVFEARRNVQQTKSRVRKVAKMAGKSALAPVAKFSSVLWLEVTGVFFGLIALVMGEAVWKLRTDFRLAPTAREAQKAYLYVAIFLVFAYFTISSFVRASRRQRR
jgi:hypothetical protein